MSQFTDKWKTPRQPDEIQRDFNVHAHAAGTIQYQLKVLPDELEKLNDKMLKINEEMTAAKDYWAKHPVKPEEQIPPPPIPQELKQVDGAPAV